MKKTTVIALSLAVITMACQKSPDTVTQNDVVHISASDAMDADSLTQSGEQLVSPYTFHLASQAFDMALAKDPTNMKAQFYSALLKRLMTMKGILSRLQPYVQRYGDTKRYSDMIQKIPNSPLKNFLLDGPQDISTVEGVQQVLANYRDGADALRTFIASNPDLQLTLNMNPYVFQQRILENYQDSCVVSNNDNGGFSVDCPTTHALEMQVNYGDLIALKQEAAGEVLYMSLYTSYSFNGTEALLAKASSGYTNVTGQQLFAAMKAADAGNLLAYNSLNGIHDLGADGVKAAKIALSMQNDLCKTGTASPQNRPGFMFKDGICIGSGDNTAAQSLALVERALAGVIQIDLTDSAGVVRPEKIDALAWARNPVQNLSQILPSSYDNCGNAVELPDATMDGVFVNADAYLYLPAPQTCAHKLSVR